jgi:hypothetical protein
MRAGGGGRTPAYALRPEHHALTVITKKADPSLVTQGCVGDKLCIMTIHTNQERKNASLREEIKSGQAEMRPIVRAIE